MPYSERQLALFRLAAAGKSKKLSKAEGKRMLKLAAEYEEPEIPKRVMKGKRK